MLLVLCCLVGVVAFFCLSLAFSTVLSGRSDDAELIKEWKELLKEKEVKEAQFKKLEETREELERQAQNREKTLSKADSLSGTQREKLEEELAMLLKERNLLLKRIEDMRKELAALSVLSDLRKKEEKEKELEALKRRFEELERKIRETRESLLLGVKESKEDSFDKKKEPLKKEIEKIKNKKRNLEKEIDVLRTKTLWAGSSKFKNPLFVECRKDLYIFYPRGEAVQVIELEKRDIFKERAGGYDIIVLFVRPEGFKSFKKAYAKVKAMSIAISYEPLEPGQSLEFLKG